MLRASPLGLRGPRVFICQNQFSFLFRSSGLLHLPAHPRHGDSAEASTLFRASSAPRADKQSWSSQQVDDVEAGREEEDDPEDLVQASAIKLDLFSNPVSDAATAKVIGEDRKQVIVPPLNQHVQPAPFLSGRPWGMWPVKPLRQDSRTGLRDPREISIPSLEDELVDTERLREDMLYILATTCSAEDGWNAYSVLSRLQYIYDTTEDVDKPSYVIPFAHLHRLARVLARNRPKTRTQFLRLLSILTTIQNCGGKIQLHEWNALIDHAGKGLRKSRPEDFNNSLSIYYDMIYNRPPGSRFSNSGFDDIFNSYYEDYPLHHPGHSQIPPAANPDIHTYTTLIDIAARTNHPPLLQRATMLLKQAKLPPNRTTHLALLKYFTAKNQLSGVRSTLIKMREQKLELGVDGLNACMWAYGHSGRMDAVMMIYRVLRHNLIPEEYDGEDDIVSVTEQLRVEEGITISPSWKPNEVTFTLMIQTMAYHRNLLAALSVFIDMLSTPNVEQGAPLVMDDNGDLQPTTYSPTIHIFRAIFLGFSRHGIGLHAPPDTSNDPDTNLDAPEWNLENLQNMFENFLQLPPDTQISESTVFWILNSFSRTSDHNTELLRTVWERMENRFGRFKGGSKHRLTKWRHKLFPEAQKTVDSG